MRRRPPPTRALSLIPLSLITLNLLSVGCGATRAPTRILREPALVLPGATYRLTTQTTCVDETVGPDRIRVETARSEDTHQLAGLQVKISNRSSTLDLERKQHPCPPTVAAEITRLTQAAARAHLQRGGYREAQDGVPVRLDIQLKHERRLERRGEVTDTKTDKPCQKACGQKKCGRFHWSGEAALTVKIAGPPFEGEDQVYSLFFHRDTLGQGGEITLHACAAHTLLPILNDSKRYDWKHLLSSIARDLKDKRRWEGFAQAYLDQYDLILLDSGVEHPAFKQGLEHAKRAGGQPTQGKPGHWDPAARAFAEALAGSLEPRAKARCAINLAGVQTVQGALTEAATTLADAQRLARTARDTETLKLAHGLSQEITRRQRDIRKRSARAAAPEAAR